MSVLADGQPKFPRPRVQRARQRHLLRDWQFMSAPANPVDEQAHTLTTVHPWISRHLRHPGSFTRPAGPGMILPPNRARHSGCAAEFGTTGPSARPFCPDERARTWKDHCWAVPRPSDTSTQPLPRSTPEERSDIRALPAVPSTVYHSSRSSTGQPVAAARTMPTPQQPGTVPERMRGCTGGQRACIPPAALVKHPASPTSLASSPPFPEPGWRKSTEGWSTDVMETRR